MQLWTKKLIKDSKAKKRKKSFVFWGVEGGVHLRKETIICSLLSNFNIKVNTQTLQVYAQLMAASSLFNYYRQ